MIYTYDSEADVLYVRHGHARFANSKHMDDTYLILNFNASNEVGEIWCRKVGVEEATFDRTDTPSVIAWVRAL